jgi:hypothetical protein
MTRFFGYGSLVNLRTHNYADPHPIQISGWRRKWVSSTLRDVAFLTATPCAHSTIQGMSASTQGIGWDALDEREEGYTRHPSPDPNLQLYVGRDDCIRTDIKQPILLSYLDCVVQGFHEHFGVDGVAAFFATTDNWDHPILDDRSAPLYPRSTQLSSAERDLVDNALGKL